MADTPLVGIFWLYEANLLIDGVPLAEAEHWGEYRNYQLGHQDLWSRYQRSGLAPRAVEYDDVPRGRVVFDSVHRRFFLYADRCILRQTAVVNRIRSELNLPPETEAGADEHYRCPRCMSASKKNYQTFDD